jgi:hypothetical protein
MKFLEKGNGRGRGKMFAPLKRPLLAAVTVIAVLFFASCGNDEDELYDPPPPTDSKH